MKLGEIRHHKQFAERIHLYAMHGSRQVDLFENWIYLMPECLEDREIVRMSYDLDTRWIRIEIKW